MASATKDTLYKVRSVQLDSKDAHWVDPTMSWIAEELPSRIYLVEDLLERIAGSPDRPFPPDRIWADEDWGQEPVFIERAQLLAPHCYYSCGSNVLKGSAADRKPDIVLPHLHAMRVGKGEREDTGPRMLREDWRTQGSARVGYWNEVSIGGELKDAGESASRPLEHQGLRILIELLRQPGRRFAIVFTVRRSKFQLFVANASGLFTSRRVDAIKEPETVSHLIRRLSELTPDQCGLDIALCPFPKLDAPLAIPTIVPGYALAKVLRSRVDITGRCTSVFQLTPVESKTNDAKGIEGDVDVKGANDGKNGDLVLKLAFVDSARVINEATVLDRIQQARAQDPDSVAGLARLADGPVLKWESTTTAAAIGMDDTRFQALTAEASQKTPTDATSALSNQQASRPSDPPILRHFKAILLDPVGVPCTHYRSRLHLWRGIIDAVKAHRNLFNLGFLHRDISTGNVMLSTSESSASASTLIDYDLTKEIGAGPSGAFRRTGTLPFMAAEQLSATPDDPCVHRLRHDLESFIWLIMWVCTLYGDPPEVVEQPPAGVPLIMPNFTHYRPGLSGSLARAADRVDRLVLNWNKSPEIAAGLKGFLLWGPVAQVRPYLRQVNPYWRSLASDGGTLSKLVEVARSIKGMEDEDAEEQYTLMLEALRHGLEVLEEVEPSTTQL